MISSFAYNLDCMGPNGLTDHEDNAFDWAICDIPYGIDVCSMSYLKETSTTVKQKSGKRLNPNRNKKPYTPKAWDKFTPDQDYFDELRRVSKNQIIFGAHYAKWDGLEKGGTIIWDKCVPDGLSFSGREQAWCSALGPTEERLWALLWSGMQQAKSLKEPTTQQGNKRLNEKRIHPCHKPVMLYDLLLREFVTPGDKIIDTHMGSGSSRISAAKFGAHYVGYEIDKEYFHLQEQRWAEFTAQQRLF